MQVGKWVKRFADLMTVADKTEALRQALTQYSGLSWDELRARGTCTKWCKLGILIAKRELDMTWKEAGACFGLTSGQASRAARRFAEKMCEEEELSDLMLNLSDQVLFQRSHTS